MGEMGGRWMMGWRVDGLGQDRGSGEIEIVGGM